MKQTLTLIFFLVGQLCFANMASPIREGTRSSSAFSSRDIDILRERIHLIIDKDFKTASYVIEYFVRTEADGLQIPLLFYAKDYQGGFKVYVDNMVVQIQEIPSEYLQASHSPFEKFSNIFDKSNQQNDSQTVTIYWSESSADVYSINDLIYFVTNLTKGEHTIRVEYTADAWKDRSGWVNEYSFRYSLSPAKFWKSFGSLEITVDAKGFRNQLTSNLGKPIVAGLDSTLTWTFQKLPANYFQINYVPSISNLTETMISIGPKGLTAIVGLILMVLHLVFIIKWKRNNPQRKYSWVLILGSLLVPFLAFVFYMYSFSLIDDLIGAEAGNYHGYPFLIMIFYPIAAPLYGLAMWLLGKIKWDK